MHPDIEQFKQQPANMRGVTVVVCSHAHHGTHTYYFPLNDFQANIKTWLVPAWINDFTVMIYPASS